MAKPSDQITAVTVFGDWLKVASKTPTEQVECVRVQCWCMLSVHQRVKQEPCRQAGPTSNRSCMQGGCPPHTATRTLYQTLQPTVCHKQWAASNYMWTPRVVLALHRSFSLLSLCQSSISQQQPVTGWSVTLHQSSSPVRRPRPDTGPSATWWQTQCTQNRWCC